MFAIKSFAYSNQNTYRIIMTAVETSSGTTKTQSLYHNGVEAEIPQLPDGTYTFSIPEIDGRLIQDNTGNHNTLEITNWNIVQGTDYTIIFDKTPVTIP